MESADVDSIRTWWAYHAINLPTPSSDGPVEFEIWPVQVEDFRQIANK